MTAHYLVCRQASFSRCDVYRETQPHVLLMHERKKENLRIQAHRGEMHMRSLCKSQDHNGSLARCCELTRYFEVPPKLTRGCLNGHCRGLEG